MKRAVALRHVAFEDLDALGPLLEGRGYGIEYREAALDDLGAGELAACDLLVVLGGPIGAYEERDYPFLAAEIALIERRLAAGRPVLGICLGAQLMARALGARVYPSGVKEIGWAPLELSAAGRASTLAALEGSAVLHWHGDTFDLPQGAGHLASTPRTPNQAFAWRRHGLALQFHIETTSRGLERWYVGHALEIAQAGGVSVAALRADAARFAPALVAAGGRAIGGWLDGIDSSSSGAS
ncbi:MAG TPA: glutamine amidotransferase [Stellaceae bacterium]|nr:glutamine amidotransferase [Stellaceae bacterium]